MILMNLNIKIAELGMNRSQLAEATGIGLNTISRYCTNKFEKIDKEHLDIFCKYFNCNVSDLLQYHDDAFELLPKDDTIYNHVLSSSKNTKDLEGFNTAQKISYSQSHIKPSAMYSKKSKDEVLEDAKEILLDSDMFTKHLMRVVEHVLFEVLKDETMNDNPIKKQLNKKLEEYTNDNKIK